VLIYGDSSMKNVNRFFSLPLPLCTDLRIGQKLNLLYLKNESIRCVVLDAKITKVCLDLERDER